MLKPEDFNVPTLGECRYPSPVRLSKAAEFRRDSTRVCLRNELEPETTDRGQITFEKAGPRQHIFFEPSKTSAAIVTCGGLSPGLNNVIRSAFLELRYNYGVKRVLGLRNGYMGLNPESGLPPIELTPEFVDEIHNDGGTVLGSSRGPQDPAVMADFLEARGVDILLCIGGDGTQKGAHAIHEEFVRRGSKKAVVGIPKTIDNDIPFVWMTFGYATAVEMAERVLRGAHVEARGAPNGIGLVKLMGRNAGYVTAGASLSSQEVNFALVPEVPFPLKGDEGFLPTLERRMEARGHALIAVAEGAGQHLFAGMEDVRDASGNVLHKDVGLFLKDAIQSHFKERGIPVNLKYIDPSYYIRSVPANTWDRVLSDHMARAAVHAGMAGKTGALIGYWDGDFTHVPISAAVAQKKQMDLSSELWGGVLASTGQPRW